MGPDPPPTHADREPRLLFWEGFSRVGPQSSVTDLDLPTRPLVGSRNHPLQPADAARRLSWTAVSSPIALAAVLAGCGSDGGTGLAPSGSVPADEFFPTAVAIACEAHFRCDAGAANGQVLLLARGGLFYGGYATRDACQAAVNDGTHPAVRDAASFADLVRAGRVDYDPEAAGDCLRAVDEAFCNVAAAKRSLASDASLAARACADVFRGTQGPGAGCADSAECNRGLVCSTDGEAACGVCEDADEPCGSTGAPCSAGSWCDDDVERCEPTVALGAACDRDAACGPEAVCNQTASGAGTCVATFQLEADAACSDTLACSGDLVCVQGRCQPLRVLEAGEPCRNEAGLLGPCAAGLFCDRSATPPVCARLRAEGETCVAYTSCRNGSYCTSGLFSNEEGVCAPVGAVGDACSGSNECASDRCASPADGGERICRDRPTTTPSCS